MPWTSKVYPTVYTLHAKSATSLAAGTPIGGDIVLNVSWGIRLFAIVRKTKIKEAWGGGRKTLPSQRESLSVQGQCKSNKQHQASNIKLC